MKETIISVEVNRAWVEEREHSGQAPFAEIGTMLETDFPGLEVSVAGHRMQVRNAEPERNARIRESIKQFFNTRYGMSIDGGDFRLSTKVRPADSDAERAGDRPAPQRPDSATRPPEETRGAEAETAPPRASAEEAARPEAPAGEEKNERPLLRAEALERFLEEFQTIQDAAKRFGMTDIVWQTNLLVSIDSGYGLSAATERVADLLEKNGFRFSGKTKPRVVEYVIPEPGERAEAVWQKILDTLSRLHKEEKESGKRNATTPLIFSLDISECMGPAHERDLHERLLQLARCKGSFLYVFRIPYVEETALAKIYATLADVFLIRRIPVPPYGNETLAAHLLATLRERKLRVEEEGIGPVLEKLILQDKQDGRFNGLRAVDKLATDILYHKLARSAGAERLTLTHEDLNRFYDLSALEEEDPERALAELCGMEEVRRRIDEIVAQIQSFLELKKSGRKLSAPTMHMRFVGNPGTGKTTVARLVAQLFRRRGILKKGYFYEIKARDLCGRYVGETAPKTAQYCRDALGSVLFIDEAYTLYRPEGRDYGLEAIETLITEMEINRDNLVVIMAGYEQEMNTLMAWNAGLASRVPYEIRFRNYTREELTKILFSMIPDGFSYSDGFERAAREFILAIPERALEDERFGNARMIRNFYERIWSKAAYRRRGSAEAELVLSEEDVHAAAADDEFKKLLVPPQKNFGF